jgi:hypothetical protein
MFWFRRRKLYRAQGIYTVAAGNTGEGVWRVISDVFRNDGSRNWMPRYDPPNLVAGAVQQIGAIYEASKPLYGDSDRFYLKEFDRACRLLSFDVYVQRDGMYRDQPSESLTFEVLEASGCVRVKMVVVAFGGPRLSEARLLHLFEHFPIQGVGVLGG